MSVSEDLINFDIIETHKENIQPLASGRSAKALMNTLGTGIGTHTITPGSTRNLNDAIREEYELELRSVQDSDDPLDIYDRYVKWTFSAYPSAQATPDARLRPLLERATKTFQAVNHYKNDPRYLKIWLHYIRFFSDTPKETFAYLSRHDIGEGLALFYEEFAVWLETAGRWNQADEVFKMGIEKEARPTERLVRKYSEFQTRYEARPISGDEPSSPALSAIRPALAAKVDPFATSTSSPMDQQAASGTQKGARPASRNSKQKLSIFSDKDEASQMNRPATSGPARGWDNIGTAADRKKENVIEPRPWTGESLRTAKRATNPPKMAVFKDQSRNKHIETENLYSLSSSSIARGKYQRRNLSERVFVDLNVVYPSPNGVELEFSFEELRANSRGWLGHDWSSTPQTESTQSEPLSPETLYSDEQHLRKPISSPASLAHEGASSPRSTGSNFGMATVSYTDGKSKVVRPKKKGFKEIKAETQTVKANLESPMGPKIKRKLSAEPTMTLHTKAATDDILDIFSQPLRDHDPMIGPDDSEGETDGDDDDNYTSAGESTGTGRISCASDFADTEPNLKTTTTINGESAAESVSPWSDFSTGKHVPDLDHHHTSPSKSPDQDGRHSPGTPIESPSSIQEKAEASQMEVISTSSPKYVPIPPEDYEPVPKYHRDTATTGQNRLPFMTPILEKTETSMNAFSFGGSKATSVAKTPSRIVAKATGSQSFGLELSSSPLQEIPNDNGYSQSKKADAWDFVSASVTARVVTKEPAIQDSRCNPVDDGIRRSILDRADNFLRNNPQFYDHRSQQYSKSSDIRKYIKSISKGKSSDKTMTTHLPPVLQFPGDSLHSFTIRRELGKGAFAPVYLAEECSSTNGDSDINLVAVKSEDPPTAWEFYIMAVLEARLPSGHRDIASFLRPRAMHLFQDEGYLFEEYRDQGTLLDLVNVVRSDPISGQTTVDESVAMFFTVELIRAVVTMHSYGILHGDLKADNCLVRFDDLGTSETEWSLQYQPDGSAGWSVKGLTLIDFGRSIDLTQFRPDVQFIADWKTGKQDCIEMRELRPWTFQVDYFGMAGIVHFLLFGKYIEDMILEPKDESGRPDFLGERKKYRIREGLRRYWQTELWSRFFDLTLNPLCHLSAETNGRMPISGGLQTLQQEMEEWLVGEGSRRNGGLKNNIMKLELRIRERRGR